MSTIKNKDQTDISLQNPDNYLTLCTSTKKEVVTQFLHVMCSYLDYVENSNVKQIFNIVRGAETVLHVFTFILNRTNNLKTAVMNAHKAFCLYIEFTEQIAEESNMVLQLSSREAVLYVYKKTIYESLPQATGNMNQNNITSECYDHFILLKILTELSFHEKKNSDFLKKIGNKIIQTNLTKDQIKNMIDMVDETNFTEILVYFHLTKK